MLVEALLVGQDVLDLPYETLAALAGSRGEGGLVVGSEVEQGSVTVIAPEGKVGAEAGAEAESVDELQFAVQAGHELVAPILRTGQREARHGVDHFIVRVAGDHVHASVLGVDGGITVGAGELVHLGLGIILVYLEDRGQGEGGAKRRTVCGVGADAGGVDLGIAEVAGQRGLVEEVALLALVEEDVAGVGAEGQTVVVGTSEIAADDTFLGVVTQREVVVDGLGSAADAEFVLSLGSVVVEHFLLPVGALSIAPRVFVDRGGAAVEEAFVDHHGVLGGVEDLTLAPGAGGSVREIIGNARGTLVALLGGYEDDSVGRTGSVDCAGGGVLEDLDALDIGRVEEVDTAFDGHSVHDIERVGIVDGTGTADADAGRFARLSGICRDVDAGCEALEGRIDADGSGLGEVFGGNLGDGGRHDALFLYAVADNDYVVEHFSVLFEDDVDHGAACDIDRLGLIAYRGYDECGVGCNVRGEDECAVEVRGGTRAGSFDHDRGSDDRLAGTVLDRTSQALSGSSRSAHA